jgi:hypothetical protein
VRTRFVGGVVSDRCECACVSVSVCFKAFGAYFLVCEEPQGEAGRLCGENIELSRCWGSDGSEDGGVAVCERGGDGREGVRVDLVAEFAGKGEEGSGFVFGGEVWGPCLMALGCG